MCNSNLDICFVVIQICRFDFRPMLKTVLFLCLVPRARLCDSFLLIDVTEMTVYYFYYYLVPSTKTVKNEILSKYPRRADRFINIMNI